jgi:AhpD family alkylhydroperoxidase
MEFQAERMQDASLANLGRAMRTIHGFAGYLAQSGLEKPLRELISIRASQINGCAFCLDMHTQDARLRGESEQRLYMVSAWRESPFYTDRERAALAWTEAVTLVADGHVPDEIYNEVRQVFSDDEMLSLTMAVIAINSATRFNVAMRTVPNYEPAAAAELAAALGVGQ